MFVRTGCKALASRLAYIPFSSIIRWQCIFILFTNTKNFKNSFRSWVYKSDSLHARRSWIRFPVKRFRNPTKEFHLPVRKWFSKQIQTVWFVSNLNDYELVILYILCCIGFCFLNRIDQIFEINKYVIQNISTRWFVLEWKWSWLFFVDVLMICIIM